MCPAQERSPGYPNPSESSLLQESAALHMSGPIPLVRGIGRRGLRTCWRLVIDAGVVGIRHERGI